MRNFIENLNKKKENVKIACKGAFYIKIFQVCKKGKNCVGVDNT